MFEEETYFDDGSGCDNHDTIDDGVNSDDYDEMLDDQEEEKKPSYNLRFVRT